MLGLMQDWPLLMHTVLDHAAIQHPKREVVTRSVEGPFHRTDYATIRARALRVAQRLVRDGIRPGDRVATLAWNTWRHLEAWYGIAGAGAVYHTVNPRLFQDQITWIMNHAGSRIMMLDLTFVPLVQALADKLPLVERFVILTDAAHMPQTTLPNAVAYEDWIAEVDGDFAWMKVDEQSAAGICYTSGTTGDPKGVVYSHRSNVIHAMVCNQVDAFGLGAADRVMPVVPMFHANGWSLALCAPMVGAGLVMPGAKLDGASVHELVERERVTFSAAVPTVWMMLLQHMEATGSRIDSLQRVAIGGSACPAAITKMYQEKYGVRVIHAWGMTELSPVGTLFSVKPEVAHLTGDDMLRLQAKQGTPPYTVEMKITDDEGKEQPWDGETFGRLKVKGPAVARRYFRREEEEILDEQGFFDTGDVATMDENGYMEITDRSKDVIKSGGEWISSIALENAAVGYPGVAEAAVVSMKDPKWDERPLLILVMKPGVLSPTLAQMRDFLADKVAKWWLPDDLVVVDEIPHTATGKILKTKLREMFKDHRPAA
ncbi:long-chain-fatty-acid--CoA ligase [Roseomonas sp. JC162]|uniref:3-methylmercaptopropionyl-CoA ligase n=1 Tax=Neoroseomonas marina TaxID=1232220 RepID=A0A848EF42_9PROT|nr:long-chain-fatty-acid--CoA ligase [Neoroseomonas marina]NMJ42087.1 long-chain-fatty-acid--CoA ligase [Neoroseomonas marina]